MSVISLPEPLLLRRMKLEILRNDIEHRGAFGGAQVIEAAPPQLLATLEADRLNERESGAWKAFFMQLRGKTNQAAIFDAGRPVPVGSLRGVWTLGANASIGSTVLQILSDAPDAAFQTLKQGDWIGVGQGNTRELVMVVADAEADATGAISVVVEPPLKHAYAAGEGATWDRPTVLMRRHGDGNAGWEYERVFASGFSAQFIEDDRP